MKRNTLLLLFLSLYFNSVMPQEKTFEREYTYNASELDSKVSCRTITINQLRLELLNEVGVYIESESILNTSEIDEKYSQNYAQQIATVSAGVTKLKILDERWDGETFWMKASITIDENEIAESLKLAIADKQKQKEMQNLEVQLKSANQELESLRNESGDHKSEIEAKKALYDEQIITLDAGNHFISGNEMSASKNFEEAIMEYSKVIELQPDNADAYNNRGILKSNIKDFNGAITDFTQTIRIDPKRDIAYYNRGNAKDDSKDFKGAIEDYNKAIKLNDNISFYYNNRGIAKGHLKDLNGAIVDYSKGLEINPSDASIYYNRGIARLNLGMSEGGCKDLSKSKELGYSQADKSLTKWCN